MRRVPYFSSGLVGSATPNACPVQPFFWVVARPTAFLSLSGTRTSLHHPSTQLPASPVTSTPTTPALRPQQQQHHARTRPVELSRLDRPAHIPPLVSRLPPPRPAALPAPRETTASDPASAPPRPRKQPWRHSSRSSPSRTPRRRYASRIYIGAHASKAIAPVGTTKF